MTRSELIKTLGKRYPHLYSGHVGRIVETIFDEITSALARGDRIELRGFGSFSARQRKAHRNQNPKTGEPLHGGKKRAPYFRAGKELRQLLNKGRST
jgi:integration host factor subunit beta